MVVGVEGKLLAALLGLAFVIAGVAIARYGAPVMVALNRLYSVLPGRMRYPMWFHKVFGGAIVLFGMLIAIVGVLTIRD